MQLALRSEMAGDWIKMRADLAEDPAVIGIADRVGLDEFAVVGRLHALWVWADAQSRDGHAHSVTKMWVNRKVQRDGFAEAMVDVGWLAVESNGISFPNFENHNGATAKTRALGKNRQERRRGNADVTHEDLFPSRDDRDEGVTREEKRREESNTPKPPSGVDARFDEFWSAYPKKTGKDAAKKAFMARKPSPQLLADMLAAVAVQRQSRDWTKDGGQYIPNPATWLNQGRWMDGEDGGQQAPQETFV